MKVVIHKFKTIENLSIEIPARIVGKNGSGKTTILEAVSFCLTGKDLSGNQFKQIYDNRDELQDSVADVSYFDDFGNEWRRTVTPIFQITRSGKQEVKVLRNTTCKKNGLETNEYSGEFENFRKFGTDWFFRQNENEQRKIFVDALKSQMPDFDVNSAQKKLAEITKSQNTIKEEISALITENKNLKAVEVPVIPDNIKKAHDEYSALTAADNSAIIGQINSRNNLAMADYRNKVNQLENEISRFERDILLSNSEIERKKSEGRQALEGKPSLLSPKPEGDLQEAVDILSSKLNDLAFYNTVEDYARDFFTKNPVLVENQNRIIALQNLSNEQDDSETNLSGACPLTGDFCDTALKHNKTAQILRIKNENRSILTKEMHENNENYLAVKRQLDSATEQLEEMRGFNNKLEVKNKEITDSFNKKLKENSSRIHRDIAILEESIKEFEGKIEKLKSNLSTLDSPELEKLPERIEIPQELRALNDEYIAIYEDIIGKKAINEHNSLKKANNLELIQVKQSLLTEIDSKIISLKDEISEYFSNLAGVVKREFGGEIEIDIELQEYVITRGEYTDCFKITANGNIFPFECNGAMQNNVKFQILACLQRLHDYNGITIMDNCEANTTQEINTCGLKAIIASAGLTELDINHIK